ncbi:MAG: hypothetical protein K2M53_10950 [Muribaculaceae bacterium]|nr:hypothetical protein [Muribaculaceae bacterium]
MKKLLTLSMALALCGSAYADSVKLFYISGKDIAGAPADMVIGTCGLAISPNGKYVAGPLENGNGIFIVETETGDFTWQLADSEDGAELRKVDNNGTAIGFDGPGITYSFQTGEPTILPLFDNVREIIGEGISNDGKSMIGTLVVEEFKTAAGANYNGEGWQKLPMPSEEVLGQPVFIKAASQGSASKYMSGDGKVILGNIGSFTFPILWEMNEENEYVPNFELANYVQVTDEDQFNENKPLLGLSAMYMCLSNNGRYAAFSGLVDSGDLRGNITVPVVYDLQEKELKVYDDFQDCDEYGGGLWPTAIADDGTFIGTCGQPSQMSSGSFIMKAGETVAKLYVDAFPDYDKVLGYDGRLGFDIPTGITPDGQYLQGYIYHDFDTTDPTSPAYWVTYVIDTKGVSGVNEVSASTSAPAAVEGIYSLDGQKLEKMTKGINIIRMSDGSAKKVMVK